MTSAPWPLLPPATLPCGALSTAPLQVPHHSTAPFALDAVGKENGLGIGAIRFVKMTFGRYSGPMLPVWAVLRTMIPSLPLVPDRLKPGFK